MSALASVDAAQIATVTGDVFAAMVDGEHGHLLPDPEPVAPARPLYAWVDMHADVSGRALLTADVATAQRLARVLLRVAPGEDLEDDDLVDAFGEVANVVGGNLKALLPVPGTLTLPRVSRERPDLAGAVPVHRVPLTWRGHGLDVAVWQLDGTVPAGRPAPHADDPDHRDDTDDTTNDTTDGVSRRC